MRVLAYVWGVGGVLVAVGLALGVSSQPAAQSVLNVFMLSLAALNVAMEVWIIRTGRRREDPALVAARLMFMLVTAAVCLTAGIPLLRHAEPGIELFDSVVLVCLGALFAFGSVFLYRRTDTSIRDDVFFRAGVVVLALALADVAVGLFVDDEAQDETVLLGLPIAVVWVALAALHRRRVAA